MLNTFKLYIIKVYKTKTKTKRLRRRLGTQHLIYENPTNSRPPQNGCHLQAQEGPVWNEMMNKLYTEYKKNRNFERHVL